MAKVKKQLVHYDPEADVLGFYMGKGSEEEFIELAPDVSLELDKSGEIIGLEILNASKVLKQFLKSAKKRKIGSFS